MKNLSQYGILVVLLMGLGYASLGEISHYGRTPAKTPQAMVYQISQDNKQYDCDTISHDIVNPTVNIICEDSSGGTGVVIKEIGTGSRIITAYHVVKGAKNIRAQQTIGNVTSFAWDLEIIDYDEEKDLAILSCNKKWAGVAEVITDHRQLRKFIPAFTFGYPGARLGQLDGILSHGFVCNPDEDKWKPHGSITSTSVAVGLGHSGGGLFIFVDGKWRVAGILSMVLVQPMLKTYQMVNAFSAFVTAKDMIEFIGQLK